MNNKCDTKFVTDFAGRSVYSKSCDWCTPPKYIEAVKKVFGGAIDLDPCSNSESIVGAKEEWSLPENNGLTKDWGCRKIYVNPPYGADRVRGTTIKNWLEKCALTRSVFNAQIIALIPVATNTSHWKQYIFGKADAICFLYDTRLKFLVNGSTENKGAPMACACVYWGDDIKAFSTVFKKFGAVVILSKLETEEGFRLVAG